MDRSERFRVNPSASPAAVQQGSDGATLSVGLVTALTVSDFVQLELTERARPDSSPQLGVLTLAATLRNHGYHPSVVNLDDLFFEYLREQTTSLARQTDEGLASNEVGSRPDSFFLFVVDRLKTLEFDVIGFSSICSSYPLTLRLVEEVKRLRPSVTTLLGGPQASVVDVATMRDFPGVDFIVRGEADETLPALLKVLQTGHGAWEDIRGLTYRRRGEVIRNRNAPVVADLDALPLPAFDLDTNMSRRTGVHLEIGRGCPFACTFCSTNDFFRRNFRLKSTPKMLEEMRLIKERYGISYFSLVHDMYTIDRKKVTAFCQALIDSRAHVTWGCSARTDCVDEELIALMARAGCRGIFFGIEAGSERMQRVINKKLDLAEARQMIRCADRHGIDTAVALITGFPEETREDLRSTIHFFIESLRYDHAEPQISLLAPLAATPIYEHYKDTLEFDSIFSDMSHQGWRHDPAEVAMIVEHPDVFPNFYGVPTPSVSRAYLKELIDFVTYLATWFRWLPVALLVDSGDFLAVFDRWRQWLADRREVSPGDDIGITPYYSHRKFRDEFVQFTESCYLEERVTAREAIAALARAEGGKLIRNPRVGSDNDQMCRLGRTAFPHLADRVAVADLGIDYKQLVDCLRDGKPISSVAARPVTVAFLPADGKVQVWQLSELCSEVLHLCNGQRTVEEICAQFRLGHTGLDGIPSDKVCVVALMVLLEQRVLASSSSPVAHVAIGSDLEGGCSSDLAHACPPNSSETQQPWPPRHNIGSVSAALLTSASDR